MKKSVLIVLSLFFVIFLVPIISAEQDTTPRIVYILPGDGLDAGTIDSMLSSADPVELGDFLEAKGFSEGKNDPSFQSLLSEGKASPLMEEFMVANQRLNIMQSTGVNPSIELVKVKDEESLEGIHSLLTVNFMKLLFAAGKEEIASIIGGEPIRGLEALDREGVTLDPGKDMIVYVNNDEQRGSFAKPYGPVKIASLMPSSLVGPRAAHELLHIGLVEGVIYCDTYEYTTWKSEDILWLALSEGKAGCPNEFDPLGCASDNPRWWKNAWFKKEEYEAHLEEIGLGPNCIPLECWEDEDCVCEPKNNYIEGFAGTKTVGNPCEPEDPHPPYCRDIMASSGAEDIGCFGDDGLRVEVIKDEGNSNGASSSPSQSR